MLVAETITVFGIAIHKLSKSASLIIGRTRFSLVVSSTVIGKSVIISSVISLCFPIP